jgi:DNA-directed RNA polymerase subunit RPC12/RpoP
MLCPMCHEEVLPDAYVCRFCGASIPQHAVTGITQRLAPDDLIYCPTCQLLMAEGFLHNPLHSSDLWWVAGPAEPDWWNGKLYGEQRVVFPITLYRCSRCGYLAAYARGGSQSPP